MTGMRDLRPGLHGGLAILALGLGGLALFAEPHPGRTVSVDTAELALAAEAGGGIAPDELAQWLIEQRADYRLLDARDDSAFAEYHIPGAERLPLPALWQDALARNETLVLYGADEMRSAQVWLLLRARGYRSVYWLEGGLEGWKTRVLFPRLPEEPAPDERDRIARARAISEHFGGQPIGGGDPDTALPSMQLPEPAAAPPPTAARKKKAKGGC